MKALDKPLPELPSFDAFVKFIVQKLDAQIETFYRSSEPRRSRGVEEFLAWMLCYPYWSFKQPTVFNPTEVVWLGNGWIIAFTPSSFRPVSPRDSLDDKAPSDFFQFKHISFANMQVCSTPKIRGKAVYTDQNDGNLSLYLSFPQESYNEYNMLLTAQKSNRNSCYRTN